MELGVLEISRYKQQDGSLFRKVRCLAGRISVFRAQDKNDLLQYRKAIEGLQTEDKFTLLLDGSEFNAKDHFFIGFGGRDKSPSPTTVSDFLTLNGIQNELVPEVLAKYLLSDVSPNTLCTTLPPITWRMLRQVSCLEGTASAGLYFLHDPFYEFTTDAKEVFADKWANLAWRKKHIVVVTELSSRPESWIDNDFIARIPLEKPRQATIGFGGGSDVIQSMVAAVRAESLPKPGKDLTALSMSQSVGKASNTVLTHPKLAILGTILLIALVTLVVNLSNSILHSYQDYRIAANASDDFTKSASNDGRVDMNNSSNQQLVGENKSSTLTDQSKPILLTAISHYPNELQRALSAAIEHPEALLIRAKDTQPVEGTNYSDGNQDPFEKWFTDLASNR